VKGEAESLAVVSQRRMLLEGMRAEEAPIAEGRELGVIASWTVGLVKQVGQNSGSEMIVRNCVGRLVRDYRRTTGDG